MRQADVTVGNEYYCKVGGNLHPVRVVVTQRVEGDGYFSKRTTFVLKRVDNGKILPKRRTASALSPV